MNLMLAFWLGVLVSFMGILVGLALLAVAEGDDKHGKKPTK